MTDDSISGERNPTTAFIVQLCCGWISILGCLGYFYIGQWKKALVFILAQIIVVPLIILTMGMIGPLHLILWVVSIVDVYMQAKELKQGHTIGQWTFFTQTA